MKKALPHGNVLPYGNTLPYVTREDTLPYGNVSSRVTIYGTEFGRSSSTGMGVGGGPNKVFGRWDPTAWEGGDCGVADPVEICRSATCYLATFGRYRSNSTSVITEIRKKKN